MTTPVIITDATEWERCNLCFGRGYRPSPRKHGGGFSARNCSRCGGRAEVPVESRNTVPAAHRVPANGLSGDSSC